MKKKLVSATFLISILIISSLVSAISVNIRNNNIYSASMEDAELPIWAIGNFWKYAMDFIFIVRDDGSKRLSVDAYVSDLYATVTDIIIMGDEEVYVLSIDGQITGEVSILEAELNIADFEGDFGGTAKIGRSNLGIREFNFEVDGQVYVPLMGWRDMYFNMLMGFVPCFDFFDFPINETEEPWDVYIDNASLYAYVDIDIPFGEHEYSSSMMFNDIMMVNRTETINVPAGQYETFVLSGTWGHTSNLWYAPVAGYLAKVDEAIYWDGGSIESEFHLSLLDTNYNVGNYPPDPPDKPYGPTQGEIETDYTYSTHTNDPNGDKVCYWFDWGDDTNSGWIGPYNSGVTVEATHRWYDKGVYNVIVKAKDEAGIESSWSEPLSVMMMGDPEVTILMHRIEKKDEIDWDILGENKPEWYYMCHAKAEGTGSPPQYNYNTDNGNYNGNWYSQNNWQPEEEHVFTVDSRNVIIKVKLMDYDDFWEGGSDDLADVSGCNYPDNDGYTDGTPDKRGAIYHGTYDIVTEELKAYNPDPEEYADFVYKQSGYYYTCGDYEPDNSIEYENGMNDPQNDALVMFRLYNDYNQPQATAQILDPPENRRPFEELQFMGIVREGIPPYTWHWDFGDDGTSDEQNPTHAYQDEGTYIVTLTVTDGFEQVSSHSIEITIINDDPILTNDHVSWTGSGGLGSTFTFFVHYIDPNFDDPTVKTVVIDGNPALLNGEGSNSDYILQLKGREIGRGTHKFYFYFEDGHGGSAQTSEKTFKVKLSRSLSFDKFSFLIHILNRLPFGMKFLKIFNFY